MKILYVNDWDYYGGAEIMMHAIAGHMIRKGHDVYFALANTEEKKDYFKVPYKKGKSFMGKRIPFWAVKDPEVYNRMMKILEKIKPDVVHCHNLSYLTLAPILAARKHHVPRLMTIHDFWIVCPKFLLKPNDEICMEKNWDNCIPSCLRRNRLAYKYEMKKRYKTLRNELLVTYAHNENTSKEILLRFGYEERNIIAIPHGIDVSLFKPVFNPSKTLIWVGKFSRLKGPEYFINTAHIIKQTHPDSRFLMIASGLDKKVHVNPDVEVIEWMPRQQLISHYSNSLALVVTAPTYPSQGLSVLEAMACGKPVITFGFCGSNEIVVDGQNGYVVKPKNCNKLAERIESLLENPDLAINFGKKARETVEREYNLQSTIRNYEKIYEALVSQKT